MTLIMPGCGIIKMMAEAVAVLTVLTAVISCGDSRGERGALSLADSLGHCWEQMLLDGKYAEVKDSAGRYYELARTDGNEELQIRAGICLGQVYTETPDSMLRYFDEILPLVQNHSGYKWQRSLLIIYNGYAVYSANTLLDYNAALYWYSLALRTAYEMEDMQNYCALLCNTSDVYYQKRDTAGLSYALEAMEVAGELDNDYLMFYSLLNVAAMYNVCGDYGKSIEILDKSGKYAQGDMYVDYLYAENYWAMGDTVSAEGYYRRIFYHDSPYESISLIDAGLGYGRLLAATGRYDMAVRYYTDALRYSAEINNRRSEAALYEELSEVYARMGNTGRSEEYEIKASQMRDTLVTIEKEREFGTLRMQYRDAINEIDAQRKDFEIREIRLSFAFSVVLFLVVMVSVLLYLRKKRQGYKDLFRRYEDRRAVIDRLSSDIDRLRAQNRQLLSVENGQGHADSEQSAGQQEKKHQRNEVLFARLEELMREKQIWRDKDISRDSVAQMLGTNTLYVSKCLSDCAGESFYAYINRYRIAEAVRLLSVPGDDTPMRAIADQIGYNSITSFYRVFQKETGVPPKYYKEALRAGKGSSQ